jgi:hypothetical protein
MTHDLKTWQPYFEEVWHGRKRFEVRKNDRDYKVGDYLDLMEYLPEESKQSGNDVYGPRSVTCRIDYILEGGNFGIEPGYIVMSITIAEMWDKSA